jgi:hypothetical protein
MKAFRQSFFSSRSIFDRLIPEQRRNRKSSAKIFADVLISVVIAIGMHAKN